MAGRKMSADTINKKINDIDVLIEKLNNRVAKAKAEREALVKKLESFDFDDLKELIKKFNVPASDIKQLIEKTYAKDQK